MKILYTAEATVHGGREGEARSSDGNLIVKLSPPKEMGGSGEGTNPEQLFAELHNVNMWMQVSPPSPLEWALGLTGRVGLDSKSNCVSLYLE